MNRLIITLALVALASTAWAQRQPQEVILPQYLPPSYKSPHGGTGYADTIIQPTPEVHIPSGPGPGAPLQGSGSGGRGPYDGENEHLSRKVNEACSGSKTIKTDEGCREAFDKHMEMFDRMARERQRQINNNLNRLGDPRLR